MWSNRASLQVQVQMQLVPLHFNWSQCGLGSVACAHTPQQTQSQQAVHLPPSYKRHHPRVWTGPKLSCSNECCVQIVCSPPPPPRGHTEPLGLGQPSASHLVVHEVGARKVCCRPPAPCCPCSCPCVEGSNHCQVVTALSQGLQSVCVGGDSSGGVGTQGGEEDNGGTALRKVRRGGCLAS
jgi:hypothetical protein